jgi:hypothetical protein
MDEEERSLFNKFRGEYLGRMASLEYGLSNFVTECLEIGNGREEFKNWLIEAPISFRYRVQLLESLLKDNVIIKTNFPNLWQNLAESQAYRNLLAHSFEGFKGFQTAKGKPISEDDFQLGTLKENIEKLKILENTIISMYVDLMQGDIPPFSSDDFADWPQ